MQHPLVSSRVLLVGLNATELNGRMGTCISWIPDKERYAVTLDDGKQYKIKADNLTVLTPESCANCDFILPPPCEAGRFSYHKETYRRLVGCCFKALCSTCESILRSQSSTPNLCVLCNKKPSAALVFGSKHEIKLLRKFAKKKNNLWAHVVLGHRYMGGDGVKASHEKALHHFKQAAIRGHADGCFNTGARYQFGQGCDQDYVKAVRYYETAVAHQHSVAMSNLAAMCATGLIPGKPAAPHKSRKLYLRAAQLGNISAADSLGYMCMLGQGGPQDLEMALKWLTVGAEKDSIVAQRNLGMWYADHPNKDIQNMTTAISWWKKAKEQGMDDEPGKQAIIRRELVDLLKMHGSESETGNTENQCESKVIDTNTISEETLSYVDKRANHEKICGTCHEPLSRPIVTIACCGTIYHEQCLLSVKSQSDHRCPYCNKKIPDEGSKKQLKKYEALAKMEVAWAQTILGSTYLDNIPNLKSKKGNSIEKGLYWYKKAAKNGDPNALYLLGQCYLPPDGNNKLIDTIPCDWQKVQHYWILSAQGGHLTAMHRLGTCYVDTTFGEPDTTKALKWLKAAGENGVEPAAEFAKQIESQMKSSKGFKRCGNVFCGKQGRLSEMKKCSRCMKMLYCTPLCQKQDWKSHKKNCVAC